ncbi:MAG TPA: adenylosuccinate synthetase [candidate division Zixibacteria bacterium]|nr:adenylosuccinate synthetase [candidate division Zixibacteria bacterium]
MTTTIIVGGFWGDEGKGKIISYIAFNEEPAIIARGGVGTNAGHTVVFKGKKYGLRMIPSGFISEKSRLLIGAGVLVDPEVFLKEIDETDCSKRIGIDMQAGIIEKHHRETDQISKHLNEKIGSTGTGCGPANEERAKRILKLAKDIPELKPYLTDVSKEINEAIESGKNILLEGTQGTMLSLFHGTYPYVTSKDVSASQICADVGIGPTKVDEVIIVFKAFMTRVGEGPMPGTLPDEESKKRGWDEYGTVTGRQRRAAPIDFDVARKAVRLNGATQIALTKLDVVFPEIKGATKVEQLSNEALEFIVKIEKETKVPVTFIGTGPEAEALIDLRSIKL